MGRPPIHVRDNASGSHGKQYGNATTSVTVTAREEWTVEYDLGGTIWGGSRFTIVKGPVVLQWTALPASAASRILMRSRKGDRQNRRLKC